MVGVGEMGIWPYIHIALIVTLQSVTLLVMFFLGFVIDGSVILTNLAAMETIPDSLSGGVLGLATFSYQFGAILI